jgi:hypothetical protein
MRSTGPKNCQHIPASNASQSNKLNRIYRHCSPIEYDKKDHLQTDVFSFPGNYTQNSPAAEAEMKP